MLRKLLALTLLFTTIPSAQAAPIYVFPVPNCEVNYARAHHDYPATDILAKAGCRFVAPTSGIVDEVNRVDTWRSPPNLGITRGGLSVSIIGDDGVRYYGSHLRSIPLSIEPGVVVKAGRLLGTIGATGSARGTAPHLRSIPLSIEPGVVVKAGRLLGTIGATGSARGTAPHLHFGISWPTPPDTWWVRRGVVLPWKYLDAWKSGKDLSPVKEVNAKREKLGELPPEPSK